MERFIKRIDKKTAKTKIEPHFHKYIKREYHDIYETEPVSFLKWNRFDIALKLFFDMKDKNPNLAERIYAEHIRAFSIGKFIEPGNEAKNSINIYIDDFDKLYKSILCNGFDEGKTLIPSSRKNTKINGAHRVASTIKVEERIKYINIDADDPVYNYTYFYNRNVNSDILDMITIKFIEYAKNVHIAFFWPVEGEVAIDIEKLIPNIIYRKIFF